MGELELCQRESAINYKLPPSDRPAARAALLADAQAAEAAAVAEGRAQAARWYGGVDELDRRAATAAAPAEAARLTALATERRSAAAEHVARVARRAENMVASLKQRSERANWQESPEYREQLCAAWRERMVAGLVAAGFGGGVVMKHLVGER